MNNEQQPIQKTKQRKLNSGVVTESINAEGSNIPTTEAASTSTTPASSFTSADDALRNALNDDDVVDRDSIIYLYEKASFNLRDDEEIALKAIQQFNYWCFKFASPRLRRNATVVSATIECCWRSLKKCHLPERAYGRFIKSTMQAFSDEDDDSGKEFVLQLYRTGFYMFTLPKKLKNDKDVMLEAIKHSCRAFKLVSSELYKSKEFVIAAVSVSKDVMELVSTELQGDIDVVIASVSYADTLKYASSELQGNVTVVMAAISDDAGYDKLNDALKYASNKVRDNRKVVLSAVKKNSYFLDYASERLQCDPEIVMVALASKQYPIDKVQPELVADIKFVTTYINTMLTTRNNVEYYFLGEMSMCDSMGCHKQLLKKLYMKLIAYNKNNNDTLTAVDSSTATATLYAAQMCADLHKTRWYLKQIAITGESIHTPNDAHVMFLSSEDETLICSYSGFDVSYRCWEMLDTYTAFIDALAKAKNCHWWEALKQINKRVGFKVQ